MKHISGFPPSPLERVGVRLLLVLLCSCSHRDLTFEIDEGLPFRLEMDWSGLQPGVEKPIYIKALFFPAEGGAAVERFVSPDGGEVRVPAGEYRVIIYNWRTNATTQTVQFRGDTYDTFEAYVAPRNVTMTTRAGRTLPLLPRPDAQLYCWNSGVGTVVISETSPTVRTRGMGASTRDVESNMLPVSMTSMVRTYVVAVSVKNYEYLEGISALTIDAYGNTPLGGGTLAGSRYAVETKVEPGEEVDGVRMYYCRITTFGLFDDAAKSLVLDVSNSEGSSQRVEIDISDAVGRVDMGAPSTDPPPVVIPPENPIVVPVPETPPGGTGGGFHPPALGDWEEEDKDIFL